MNLFTCKVCESKEREILWLQAEHEKLLRLVGELREPGIMRRVELKRSKPADALKQEAKTKPPPLPTYPGYERTPGIGETEVT